MTSSQLSTLKLSIVCLVGLSASSVAPTAAAASSAGAYYAEANLATAAPAVVDKELDGVRWTCEGDKCVGKAARRASLDSYMKECRKVAANLGKLTRFFSRGREMNARDLDNCNRAAS